MASGPVAIEVGNPSGEVRPEDSFDIAAVHTWLAARVPELAGQTLPTVSQFGGGASNLTYALAYPNLQLVLRRPPVGTKAAGAHDMSREYEIQRLLRPHFPAVPEVLAHCPAEGSPLGGEFYVMVRAEGTILRADLPPGMTVEPADAARLGLGCSIYWQTSTRWMLKAPACRLHRGRAMWSARYPAGLAGTETR
jgi:hypothetical protein